MKNKVLEKNSHSHKRKFFSYRSTFFKTRLGNGNKEEKN